MGAARVLRAVRVSEEVGHADPRSRSWSGIMVTDVPSARRPDTSEAIATQARPLDGWVVPPHTPARRNRGRGSGRRTETMTQPLTELIEQFCNFERKQRGKTAGGVQTYR
jgi:hypothetical protein